MRLIVLSEYFPPDRNSAASQMNDLVNELCSQGHDVILITLSKAADVTGVAGYPKRLTVIPVSVPSKKGGGSARRLFMEMIAPFFVLRHLRKQPGLFDGVDSIIWYAPTIFLWPVIRWLKSLTGAKSYLILRDIFPEWAVSLGLLKKGPIYIFLKLVERLQYRTADVIGVQTPGDLKFLKAYNRDSGTLEVLPQWQTPPSTVQKSEASTHSLIRSKGLRTFVYLGNMGAAQNCGVLIDMMFRMDASRHQLIFVGDGTEKENLKAQAAKMRMNNVRFLDAVAQEDVPSLLSECDVGLIALKASHTTNNLPGKLMSYVHNGLPVLASINPTNDLCDIMEQHGLGLYETRGDAVELAMLAERLVAETPFSVEAKAVRKKKLSALFSTQVTTNQILHSLKRFR